MLMDQDFFRPDGSANDPKDQVPLRTSPDFVHTYHAQAHEIIDAIAAVVTGAHAGLNWLRAEPPDLEEVRKALDRIVNNGKRACEIIVRLRALTNEGAHATDFVRRS